MLPARGEDHTRSAALVALLQAGVGEKERPRPEVPGRGEARPRGPTAN